MLANTTHLKGLVIRATDGEIGTVDQLYFDDESWAIRYLTVRRQLAGGPGNPDSPFSVTNVDWPAKRLDVELTKKQVTDSPSIDTQRPVSDSTRRISRLLRLSQLLERILPMGQGASPP